MESIGKLLKSISVNYPRFRSEICNKDGTSIRPEVLTEWQRHIGFLDYEEALERLDRHMASENGNHIPKPMDLRKAGGTKKDDIYHAPIEHRWHLEFSPRDPEHMHGRMYDQNDYEYVHVAGYEDGYHYDRNGRICTLDGKVVH